MACRLVAVDPSAAAIAPHRMRFTLVFSERLLPLLIFTLFITLLLQRNALLSARCYSSGLPPSPRTECAFRWEARESVAAAGGRWFHELRKMWTCPCEWNRSRSRPACASARAPLQTP